MGLGLFKAPILESWRQIPKSWKSGPFKHDYKSEKTTKNENELPEEVWFEANFRIFAEAPGTRRVFLPFGPFSFHLEGKIRPKSSWKWRTTKFWSPSPNFLPLQITLLKFGSKSLKISSHIPNRYLFFHFFKPFLVIFLVKLGQFKSLCFFLFWGSQKSTFLAVFYKNR